MARTNWSSPEAGTRRITTVDPRRGSAGLEPIHLADHPTPSDHDLRSLARLPHWPATNLARLISPQPGHPSIEGCPGRLHYLRAAATRRRPKYLEAVLLAQLHQLLRIGGQGHWACSAESPPSSTTFSKPPPGDALMRTRAGSMSTMKLYGTSLAA